MAKYYMTQRWLWYKFLKHKTLHIVKTYCSLDKIKNHKSSHFSCFKSIFSFLIIIISSASIETKWSKSIGQSSGHFELLMISKISLIEVQNFIYPWMRFWAGPTSFFWSKGSRGLLEVSFKGVMETSSRREFRIFRLRKGFNWNANWKNLLELFNWRLYKKSGDRGPVQPGPSKSQSELPVFF